MKIVSINCLYIVIMKHFNCCLDHPKWGGVFSFGSIIQLSKSIFCILFCLKCWQPGLKPRHSAFKVHIPPQTPSQQDKLQSSLSGLTRETQYLPLHPARSRKAPFVSQLRDLSEENTMCSLLISQLISSIYRLFNLGYIYFDFWCILPNISIVEM